MSIGFFPAAGVVSKIDEQVGTGASGVLEFTSIPAHYRTLYLTLIGRSTVAATAALVQMTFESSPTSGSYNYQYLRGNGATAASAESIGAAADYIFAGAVPGASATANASAGVQITLPEYSGASLMKTILAQAFSTTGIASNGLFMDFIGGLYESTSAIDRIKLTLSAGSWATTSRATLYAIR